MSGHQQTIYTIQESQLNNSANNGAGQRNSSDLLIDTSTIPMMSQQQTMPPIQHAHQQLQPTTTFNQYGGGDIQQQTITSQPAATSASSSSRVAPERQNIVYSVHPVFNMLDNHDTLLIRQKADCTSTCCGFESVNTYTVRGRDGTPVLKAIENSNCCERCCFEGNRGYNLSLVSGEEVVARIRKPYRVSRFCCYTNSVRIESPEDNPIGQIKQMFTLFGHARYAIFDCQQPPKSPSFYIESTSCRFCFTPCLCTCICGNKEFKIISTESKEEVGTISRHWSTDINLNINGDLKNSSSNSQQQQQGENTDGSIEMINSDQNPNGPENLNPDQDQEQEQDLITRQQQQQQQQASKRAAVADQVFGVQFTSNLEARHKVLLLSACFMMDFFYFENDRRRRKLASC